MRVEVSGRQFTFPPICACCGNPANTNFTVSATKTTGKKVVKTSTNTWDFPYCAHCISHINAAKNASSMSTLVGVGSVLLALFFCYSVAMWFGTFVFIAGIVGAVVLHSKLMAQAKAMSNAQCACIKEAVAFLDWDGARQVFEITSPNYALAFMVANSRKLVNLSSYARQLLESNGHGNHTNDQQSGRRFRS